MLLVTINVKYFEFFSGMMDIDNICRQCSGISVAREIDLNFERPLNYVTILNQKFGISGDSDKISPMKFILFRCFCDYK